MWLPDSMGKTLCFKAMANYRINLEAAISQERLFTYIATFSNAVDWDPAVTASREESPGPVVLGSAYHLDVKFGKQTRHFTYTIVEIDPPRRVVLEAITKTFYTRDVITFRALSNGASALSLEATLRLRGFAAILNGFLLIPFRRMGNHARQGLAAALSKM